MMRCADQAEREAPVGNTEGERVQKGDEGLAPVESTEEPVDEPTDRAGGEEAGEDDLISGEGEDAEAKRVSRDPGVPTQSE